MASRPQRRLHAAAETAGEVAGGGEHHQRPAGKAAVHAGDAEIATTGIALKGLQGQQGEQPVPGRGGGGAGALDVVVLGGDQHVDLVGGAPGEGIAVQPAAADRRLEKGRPGQVVHHQRPGGLGLPRGESGEAGLPARGVGQGAPRRIVIRRGGLARAFERQGGKLDEEPHR